jgi:hypothetical protein
MGKCYTAVNTAQFAAIIKQRSFVPLPLEQGGLGLVFTEDKKYWVNKIQEQADLEKTEDYQYSILIEWEIPVPFINALMENEKTGRLSAKMVDYHKLLDKQSPVKPLQPAETDVLCILDVHASPETGDGLSQVWMIRVNPENDTFWNLFIGSITAVRSTGGIPGAVEIARRMVAG